MPTNPLTPDDLAALRQQAEQATPGPWAPHAGQPYYVMANPYAPAVAQCGTFLSPHLGNAAFIAAFNPAVALALLDDLRDEKDYAATLLAERDAANQRAIRAEQLANRVNTDANESAASNVADEQEDEKELEELRAQVQQVTQERDRLRIALNEIQREKPHAFNCPCWVCVSERFTVVP